jgi:hypothetical protein
MVGQFWQYGKFKDLKQVFPYGKTKVQHLVRSGRWREGLHYVTDEVGDRLYNLTLISDWVANLNDPIAHQRACELYLASLPSNQPTGRKPSQRKAVAA